MKGFSLIELMVVVSLVGVFASTVLSSLSDVRLLAKSTANNEVVRQYILAINSVYASEGHYPYHDNISVCLGDYDDDWCGTNNQTPERTSLLNEISQFYPSLSKFDTIYLDIPFFGTIPWEGPIYTCTEHNIPSQVCSNFAIAWIQMGLDQPCLPSENPSNGTALFGENTVCIYEMR